MGVASDVIEETQLCWSFIGAQALLDLVYGVLEGDFHKLFKNMGTMTANEFIGDNCAFGSGLKSSVDQMFKNVKSKEETGEKINYLAKEAKTVFKRLGFEFPYLEQEFTPVDMEHSLRYFSRRLKARRELCGKNREDRTKKDLEPLIAVIDAKECPRVSIKIVSDWSWNQLEGNVEKYITKNVEGYFF